MKENNDMPVIKVTPSQAYYDYIGTMIALYGDAFVEWCKTDGQERFMEWPKKQGLEFVELTNRTAK